jgi:chromosome segregation protein
LRCRHELAEQRAAEAALEKQRLFHAEQSDCVAAVQGRYYEIGAQISRTEQSIQHTRELRERQRTDLAQARGTHNDLALHMERDERELAVLRAELAQLAPKLASGRERRGGGRGALAAAEHALQLWQARWEEFNRALGAAHQTTQVERARIEQLENQQRRLATHADRLRSSATRSPSRIRTRSWQALAIRRRSRAPPASNSRRHSSFGARSHPGAARRAARGGGAARSGARRARTAACAELVSLEALQQAAFNHGADGVAEWLGAAGLAGRPRVAAALEVAAGWERAVETALGDYLEAVCVERLDEVGAALENFAAGRLALIEAGARGGTQVARTRSPRSLQGPRRVTQQLERILTAESLADALARRRTLDSGWSLMTRRGEWVGRDWLRVTRGADPHAGVIEREQRLKELRAQFAGAAERARAIEAHLNAVRESLAEAEIARNAAQSGIQGAHRAHADLLGQLEAMRARSQEVGLRRARLEEEAAGVADEITLTHDVLARAARELARGLVVLGELDAQQPQMHSDRDETREALLAARAAAQAAQLAARDLLIRSESVRTAENSLAVGLKRMTEQSAQVAARCAELERELAGGDAPILELEARLAEALARRLDVEAELAGARAALEEADGELRALDERRAAAEQRVQDARTAMEEARLAASETRVRRESIAEQFAATQFVLAEIEANLQPEASIAAWEDSLAEARADVEKLGQVNLAAIDELKEQTDRKEYLDRQYADLSDALTTLEQAMRRIDKETRARFEETFERINTGLKEKFPQLFGGGHAYLELVGEDVLSAGVAVMARPPGKRNSTIHPLVGRGEGTDRGGPRVFDL